MAIDDTTAGAVLLGFDGVEVTRAEEHEGELVLWVQTTAGREGCRVCGVVATPHARRTSQIRDVAAGGRPVRLVWRKRIWRCDEPACAAKTWTEQRPDLAAPRASLTERARRDICRQVGKLARPVAQVAVEYGVGWHTAMAAVRDHGRPLVDDPARIAWTTAIGVDETSFTRAGPRRRTRFVTGLVDLSRGNLLDVVDGRAGSAVTAWLACRDEDWLSAVTRVALDPYRGYYNALVAGLDAPEVVVDAFHVVRLGNSCVDDVRRRVQDQTLGHRGRKGDPLYGIRRLLLTAEERLSSHGRARLRAGLAAGDPHDEVWYAHLVKELLRDVYRAGSEAAARDALEVFYDTAAAAAVPECDRLARTIRRWEPEVLAYWRTDGLSNGRTEAVNGLIKRIKRIGHGFRNLDNYRLRLLLFCGGVAWHDQPTARIRGRNPRFAA